MNGDHVGWHSSRARDRFEELVLCGQAERLNELVSVDCSASEANRVAALFCEASSCMATVSDPLTPGQLYCSASQMLGAIRALVRLKCNSGARSTV